MTGSGRRNFNQTERDALFLAADGVSDISGEPLAENWHADHREPWSQGGATDVANGQAANPRENLSKGSKSKGLRAWQQEFLERLAGTTVSNFLLCALPGAGKTFAALQAARRFLSAGRERKLIVVVPTRPLRKQWRVQAWDEFQIGLQESEFRGSLKDGCAGVVVTYSGVAQSPMLFRRLCALHECFVVFDEIHHAGERAAWGEALEHAFEGAKFRLCLSGTPFRSDGKKIPFLHLLPDGTYDVNFGYDYPRALRDDVVRSVAFHRYAGSVTISENGGVWEFHTDDELDETAAGKRLRGLLHHQTYTGGLLRRAHEKLMEVRQLHPRAGALAVCMNQIHAQNVARLLFEITGEQPDIVVSDEDVSTGSIDAYRDSGKAWIVAVRMVSEGVDIKRLMVLAYLTNIKTPMAFRQTVGRVVRREGEEDIEAYCVMPDDPGLSEMAEAIERVQVQVLQEDEEERSRHEREQDDGRRGSSDFTVLDSSEPEFAGMTARASVFDRREAEEIREMASRHGIAESKMADIFREMRRNTPAPESRDRGVVPTTHPEDALKILRNKVQNLAKQLAYLLKVEFKDVHIRYKKEVDGTTQSQMSQDQLDRKLQWILANIAQAKRT